MQDPVRLPPDSGKIIDSYLKSFSTKKKEKKVEDLVSDFVENKGLLQKNPEEIRRKLDKKIKEIKDESAGIKHNKIRTFFGMVNREQLNEKANALELLKTKLQPVHKEPVLIDWKSLDDNAFNEEIEKLLGQFNIENKFNRDKGYVGKTFSSFNNIDVNSFRELLNLVSSKKLDNDQNFKIHNHFKGMLEVVNKVQKTPLYDKELNPKLSILNEIVKSTNFKIIDYINNSNEMKAFNNIGSKLKNFEEAIKDYRKQYEKYKNANPAVIPKKINLEKMRQDISKMNTEIANNLINYPSKKNSTYLELVNFIFSTPDIIEKEEILKENQEFRDNFEKRRIAGVDSFVNL